jgi:hypothetical protein
LKFFNELFFFQSIRVMLVFALVETERLVSGNSDTNIIIL